MSYNKLHSSLVNSSLWMQRDDVRLLFITMLAMCDRYGFVYGSRYGIERAANIDFDPDDNSPWEILMAPDKDSSDRLRNPDNEGRRIEEVPGGFRLLNFEYYRGLRNDDDRRRQNREAQERFRNKPPSAAVSHGQPPSANVSPAKPPLSVSVSVLGKGTEEEKKSTKGKPTKEEVVAYAHSLDLSDGEYFFDHWMANGWTNGGKPIKDWQATIRSWKAAGHCPSQNPKPTGAKPWVAAAESKQAEIDAANRAYREKKRKAFELANPGCPIPSNL